MRQNEDEKKAIRMAEVIAALPEQVNVECVEQVHRAHKNFVQVCHPRYCCHGTTKTHLRRINMSDIWVQACLCNIGD